MQLEINHELVLIEAFFASSVDFIETESRIGSAASINTGLDLNSRIYCFN